MSEDIWLARVREVNKRGDTLVDLDVVDDWMRQLTPTWEAHGYTVERFPVTRDLTKNSVRLDIDGPAFVATTIVWDSGEWDVSVGRVADEHIQTSVYTPACSTDEVLAKVEQAMCSMGIM